MVIGLYEKFFFQSDVGAYPMFHMPSLIDMPGFLSMRARGKQPIREVHLASRDVPAKPVLRSAKPEAATSKAILVAAAATAATKAAAAAATKAVAVAAAATKAPPAVGHKGGETKAKQAIAAEEDAKALEAREVWTRRCSTCAKSYHPVTRMLDSLLESIPAKGKLALQAGVLTHTRTPAHPHTRTCA